MPLITRRGSFITPPQYAVPIDTLGLGKGVQLLFNPALGPVDQVTQRVWTPTNNATVATSAYGKAFSFDGIDDDFNFTGYPEISGNVGTFAVYCPVVGPKDTFGQVLFGDSSVFFYIQDSLLPWAWGISSTTPLSSWFGTINRSLVFTSDGTSTGTKVYLDGVDSGAIYTGSPLSFSSSTKSLVLGRYGGGAAYDFSGTMLSSLYLPKTWGAAEAKAYHQSKGSAIFQTPVRRLWAMGASAGGTAYFQSLAGSLTPAGALAKQTSKQLAGSSTGTGALAKKTSKSYAGSITGTGSLAKMTAHSFVGSITPSGTLATMILFTCAIAGSITASGALSKMTLKALTGASTFSGAITKLTSKGLSASITMSGLLSKLTKKAFAGSVTVTGSLAESYQVLKSLAGSITPTGAVTALYIAFVAGILKMLALLGVGQ